MQPTTGTPNQQVSAYAPPLPRAVRDVRDAGIPIVTKMITSESGKRMASYRLGSMDEVIFDRAHGRKTLPKKLKQHLLTEQDSKCSICLFPYDPRYLQIDHCVPYEVAGDDKSGSYMLVCGECNRAKSWACEHCANWINKRLLPICQSCYWASPEDYDHVAEEVIRRLDLAWSGDEVRDYDLAEAMSRTANQSLPDFVKAVIKNRTQNGTDSLEKQV